MVLLKSVLNLLVNTLKTMMKPPSQKSKMCGRLKSPPTQKTPTGCFPPPKLFDLFKLHKRIQKNEGYRKKPYNDIFGNKTIGYGHLIKNSESFLLKNAQSKKYLTSLFIKDVNSATKNFIKHYKTNIIPKNVQGVVIEMIFQLGINNMLDFKRFNTHINKNQLYMAALEMIDSRWYKQTPRRVDRLITIMIYNHNE